jgi:apolipoprotein N-acyltransferase
VISAILAGALLSLATFSTSLWPLSWVGIYLLFRSLLNQHFKVRMQRVAMAQLLYFGVTLHWTSTYVGSLPWLLLITMESILFLIPALFSYRRTIESALLFSLAWCAADFLRMKFPFGGFGWARIGFFQIDSPLRPLLALGGVVLLQFLLIFFSTSVAIGLTNFTRVAVISLVIVLSGYLYQNLLASQRQTSDAMKVAAVQGGVRLGIDFNRTPEEVFSLHRAVTVKNLKNLMGSDLILWPENSVDIDPFEDQKILTQLIDLNKNLKSPLLVGAVLNDRGLRNASLWISDQAIQRYYKVDLAPFGEYIPLRSIAEKVSSYTDEVTDFQPGESGSLFHQRGFAVLPLICFEVLDDQFVASRARNAAILAIQTNNATFGRSSEAMQQFLINRVRAYETHKPAVIASTTGITAIVNEKGEIVSSVEQFTAGVAMATVNPQTSLILRTQFPYLTELILLGIFLALVARKKVSFL